MWRRQDASCETNGRARSVFRAPLAQQIVSRGVANIRPALLSDTLLARCRMTSLRLGPPGTFLSGTEIMSVARERGLRIWCTLVREAGRGRCHLFGSQLHFQTLEPITIHFTTLFATKACLFISERRKLCLWPVDTRIATRHVLKKIALTNVLSSSRWLRFHLKIEVICSSEMSVTTYKKTIVRIFVAVETSYLIKME
jgi:hypothetical protein